jgi:peptidoglycan/xylan/chitin deacetylase (PgdA/CDA1 family)
MGSNVTQVPGYLMPVLHGIGGFLSPAGPRARLCVLIYHRVLASRDPILDTEPDAKIFSWQMEIIAQYFNVLHLSEAIERLRDGSLPARAACITFDDGYADNVEVALPILQQWGLPATFFIASGYLDGGEMWNDSVIEAVRQVRANIFDLASLGFGAFSLDSPQQRASAALTLIDRLKHMPPEERDSYVSAIVDSVGATLRKDLMMRSEQVKSLSDAGMEIGAHTVNHSILCSLTDGQARFEIASSKEQLSAIVGKPIRLFAYPNGKPGRDYNGVHVRMVKELGFLGAVSTAWGTAGRSTDVYQIPRFTPWDRRATHFVLRLFRNYWTRQRNAEINGHAA